MTISHAQREFEIRHYHWAITETEREVAESLPSLWLFRAGATADNYRFICSLSVDERISYARAAVKRGHPVACKALGLKISAEEQALFERNRRFCSQAFLDRYSAVKRGRAAGQEFKFATRGQLRKAVTKQFRQIFGSRCVALGEEDPGARTTFHNAVQRLAR